MLTRQDSFIDLNTSKFILCLEPCPLPPPRDNGRRGDSRQVTSHLTNPWGADAEHSPTPCNYRSAGPKGKQQHPLVYDISSSSDILFILSRRHKKVRHDPRYRLSPWPHNCVGCRPAPRVVCDMWESMACMNLSAKERERAARFLQMGGVSSSLV